MKSIYTFLLVVLWTTARVGFSQSVPTTDFLTIQNQIFTTFQGSTSPSSLNTSVSNLLPLINANGSFSDINYNDRGQTVWKPGDHLTRMATLAKAYSNVGSSYYNQPALLTTITNLMAYWISLDPAPSSTNWYYYAISVPKDVGNTLICLRKAPTGISSSLENSMIAWMTKGVPITTAPSSEGSNLIDVAMHYIMRASLLEDATLMAQTVTRVANTIEVTTGEGIQIDHSFKAHGSQLYTYGYGSVFVSGITSIAHYLHGSSFELPPAKIAIVSNFMRNGFIPASRGKFTDFNVYNRGISRTNAGKAEAGQVERFAAIDLPTYATYYTSVLNRMKGISRPSVDVQPSNTHFWRSDYTVHHRPQFMLGLRSVSSRTVKAENGNGESLKSYYMTEGVTYIAVNGNEYDGIYPAWNWSKLPGTTVPELATLPVRTAWGANPGKSVFVGATSDGTYGVHTYAMNDYSTTAKKAWFMFDKEVVCLGAGITSTAAEPINTTINQSLLEGDVTLKTNEGLHTLSSSFTQSFTDNLQWIYHDSIAYFFPLQGQITVQGQTQSGTMKSINSSLSDNLISKDVFSTWFPHGVAPSQQTYAYTIVAGLEDLAAVHAYNSNAIEILENSPDIQAVKHATLNMLQIVFYKKGTFSKDGISITVDKPIALIIKDIHTNQVTIHASDPTQNQRQLTIGFASSLLQPMRQTKFNLPIESAAGSSISGTINIASPNYVEPSAEVESIEIIAIADAFVRDGSYATTNYGTNTTMALKNDAVGYARQVYLKFDLSANERPVSKAKLRMYVTNANATAHTTQWSLSQSLNTTWEEGTIAWNNKPAPNKLIQSVAGINYADYVEWDITQLVNTSQGSQLLSFQITSTAIGSTTDASFASKEHANPLFHPAILMENQPMETIDRQAVDDSWVRSGTHATKNYGAAGYLVTRGGGTDINTSYLKFDLKGISNTIVDATLRLYNQTPVSTTWQLNYVSDNNWTEGIGNFEGNSTSGITWNTAPMVSSPLASHTGSTPEGYVDFDISSLTKSLVGDSIITLQITSPTDIYSSFSSRNNATVVRRPLLRVNTLQKKAAKELQKNTILEDAFVRGGSYGNDNYGSSTVLTIKNDGNAAYAREVFLKVDLDAIPTEANYVTLRLYVTYAGATISSTNWDLYSVPNVSWSQNSLTWNTKPAPDAFVTTANGRAAGSYVEFDLTDYIRQLRAQDNSNTRAASLVQSFKIISSVASSNGDASFASIEASNPDFHPSLVSYFDENMSPLPVEYLYIKGSRLKDGAVLLDWATVSEIDHRHFDVERSTNGRDFEPIARIIQPTSQAATTKTYVFKDREFAKNFPYSLYYRLTQIDYSGAAKRSSIISVNAHESAQLQYGPNPTKGFVKLYLPIVPTNPLPFQLMNLTGQLVGHQQLHDQITELDLNSLSKGLYLGTIHYPDGRRETIKIVLQ